GHGRALCMALVAAVLSMAVAQYTVDDFKVKARSRFAQSSSCADVPELVDYQLLFDCQESQCTTTGALPFQSHSTQCVESSVNLYPEHRFVEITSEFTSANCNNPLRAMHFLENTCSPFGGSGEASA